MRFFNLDQHISVIADIADIFRYYGHTVDSISLSGHTAVMGLPKGYIPMLNGDNWCNLIHDKKWNDFFDVYAEALKDYDAFIVTYPPIFSLLYEKFDKPIIIDIPIRYENGCDSDVEVWKYFNEYLHKGSTDNRIKLVANSLYDKKYTEAFTGCDVKYIPSLCEYTKARYNRKRDSFIYYHNETISAIEPCARRKHDVLQFGHSWQQLYNYAGIIHIPYNVSTMSIFEQYTACVPLFFPTKRLLLEMYVQHFGGVLSQYSNNKLMDKQPESLLPFNGSWDPNAYTDTGAISHWLNYADFYNTDQMPCLQYFDSFDELNDIMKHADNNYLDSISAAIHLNNIGRKRDIYAAWKEVLNGL